MLELLRKEMEHRMNEARKQLADLGERHSPIYLEEHTKSELKGTIAVLEELLELNDETEDSDKKSYRVELVDFIDAHTEHEAIDIFIRCIPDIDVSDEAFDVYEIDPLTKKAI